SGEVAVHAEATADPDARRRLAGIALARGWSRGAWNGQFEVGHDWTDTRIDAYSEAGGAGIALSVPGRSVDTRRGRFDVSAQRTGSQAWGVWQASLGLGWRQEFDVQRRQLAVTLREDIAGNVVRFDTQDTDRGWGEWSLGSAFTFAGGHSAFVEYRQRFAHDFLSERLLALGWRVELQ
ncbi:MAG TPA: autotransporter outer membrane beta-barrel domain-containing protein, partial [Arenimonas sp.]|nr:autotransporter outer membrane beta-barrel domain-containing protein [Arenimonas sp.]